MEFSSQEYLGGLPFPSPGDLPDPGIEPGSPTLQADSLPVELSTYRLKNTILKVKHSTLFMNTYVYNIFMCGISGRFSTNTCQITKNYVFSLLIILVLC